MGQNIQSVFKSHNELAKVIGEKTNALISKDNELENLKSQISNEKNFLKSQTKDLDKNFFHISKTIANELKNKFPNPSYPFIVSTSLVKEIAESRLIEAPNEKDGSKWFLNSAAYKKGYSFSGIAMKSYDNDKELAYGVLKSDDQKLTLKGEFENTNLIFGMEENSKEGGETYIGNFYNGKYSGYGKKQFNLINQKQGVENFYVGNWLNGKKHGLGRQQDQSGDTFEGTWASDLKEGKGIFCDINGEMIKGEWKKGLQAGFGIVISDSMISFGTWKDGLKEGKFTSVNLMNGEKSEEAYEKGSKKN